MLRCLHLSALLVIASGCSVLFQQEEGVWDSGPDEVVDAAVIDALVPGSLGSQIEIEIGEGMDFPDYASWKQAREGDLTMRQFMKVTVAGGSIAADEVLVGSGCSGQVRTHSVAAVASPFLTLDLQGQRCEVGDVLTTGDGATVTVGEISNKGIKEVVILGTNTIAPVIVEGFTADASSYLSLRAAKAHVGIPGEGIVIRSIDTPNHGFDIRVPYTRLHGFEVTNWATEAIDGSSKEGVRVAASPVFLDRMLIHDDGGKHDNANSDGIYSSEKGLELTVRNSFIYNVGRAGILLQNADDGLVVVENSSFANCMLLDNGTGRYDCVAVNESDNTKARVINTLVLMDSDTIPSGSRVGFIVEANGSTNNTNTGFDEASTNNACSDNTAPQANFNTASGGDIVQSVGLPLNLHLQSGSSLVGQGTDLPDNTHDIDGDPRSSPWSIGADQVVAP